MLTTSRNSVFHKSDDGLVVRSEDGTHVMLRGLTEHDSHIQAEHLQRLTPEDRRMRFHNAMSDAALSNYTDHVDWRHALAYGAFVDGTLRGVSEMMLESGDEAEVSISIEKEYQRIGLGRILVGAMILTGRNLGLKTLHMYYFRDNERMRALARVMGARPTGVGNVMEGIIRLDLAGSKEPSRMMRSVPGVTHAPGNA